MINVSVIGIGYVGLATASLWAGAYKTTVFDIVEAKVDAVNNALCPFEDSLIDDRLNDLANAGRPLQAALNAQGALRGADVVMIAVPTNYSEALGAFDTGCVEAVFAQIAEECPDATVILRSTVQPGETNRLAQKYGIDRILYCPEFLREGRSLDDCLHPSRIVVGCDDDALAGKHCAMLEEVYAANDAPTPPIVRCSIEEAEAAKLFSNTYLALRVAFFNQLDSFALHRELDAGRIMQAVCADSRIGAHYNNPSFGYGGYCLPKDTKALLASFGNDVPNDLIEAIVSANDARKRDVVETVLAREPKRIGIYRLAAKTGSDNMRSSAAADIVNRLVARGADVVIYEPLIADEVFRGARVTRSLEELFDTCDIVLANRMDDELLPYRGKVFTRDLFRRD